MNIVLALFFGCRHRHQGRPISIDGESYVVCLDCGQRFEYDSVEFKMGRRLKDRSLSVGRGADGMPLKGH